MGQPILHEQTEMELRKQNADNFEINLPIIAGRMQRPPLRRIYIHTVAKAPQDVIRNLFPRLHLKACEEGETYTTCHIISDPITQWSPDQERGGRRPDDHDGWKAAIDLLNSSNTTTDPYAGSEKSDYYANKQGTNLMALGFWPSLREIPPQDEIKRAQESAKKNAQWLTREAIRLSSRSKKDLDEFLQTYPQTYQAMDLLGLTAEWHSPTTIMAFCPNCGETIRPGIAFHRDAENTLCIIDAMRTLKAGKITKEQYDMMVPEDKAPEPKPRRG